MITHDEVAHLLPDARMLVGEHWLDEGSLGRMDHVNPSTGRVQASFPVAGPEEVDAAVKAARSAHPAWRAMPADERRRLLLGLADALAAHEERFSTIWALETGVPRRQATAAPVDQLQYYAGWSDKLAGEMVHTYPGDALDYVLYEPWGVVAALITWNGPLINAMMKIAPALAAGNCVVLKTPELGPFAPVLMGELFLEAGLPPGVLNIISGGPEAGDALVRHPGVDKISLTGSVPIARKVLQAAAENLTPCVLELGGKSANLVFADADLDAAATHAAFAGAIANAGQVCLAPTRLLIEDSVYDDVLERVVAIANSVPTGDPLDGNVVMGPLISQRACERIMGVIDKAQREGAGELVSGGRRLGGELADGYFLSPAIFSDVDNASTLAREEIFGPVLSAMRFRDEDEAVRLANETRFGLAGYLHTNDLRRAHRIAKRLNAGYLSVNGHNPMPATSPFGGFGLSGHGREGGRQGFEEFLRPKNVYVALG